MFRARMSIQYIGYFQSTPRHSVTIRATPKRRTISLVNIIALAKALGVKPGKLFNW